VTGKIAPAAKLNLSVRVGILPARQKSAEEMTFPRPGGPVQ
jgi:hypothetical protein